MASRRLEKVSHIILSTVGSVIQNQLSDPRIQGLVSITRIELSPDMRNARVYLSVAGVDETKQELCLRAIEHANGFIQRKLGNVLQTKVCPTLHFHLDNSIKKGAQISQLLDQIAEENLQRQCQTNEHEELTESDNER